MRTPTPALLCASGGRRKEGRRHPGSGLGAPGALAPGRSGGGSDVRFAFTRPCQVDLGRASTLRVVDPSPSPLIWGTRRVARVLGFPTPHPGCPPLETAGSLSTSCPTQLRPIPSCVSQLLSCKQQKWTSVNLIGEGNGQNRKRELTGQQAGGDQAPQTGRNQGSWGSNPDRGQVRCGCPWGRRGTVATSLAPNP